jgi:flagellar motor switch protein FliG
LDPIVKALENKNFEEDKEYLSIISKESPSLAQELGTRVWRPEILFRIPSSFLKESLNGLSREEKIKLIYGLPEQESGLILSLIPDGNLRTIILDEVNKLKDRNEMTEMKESVQFSKTFLSYLRNKNSEQEFTLETTQAQEPPGQLAA